MLELLIRTETLFVGLTPVKLMAIGMPALVVGLIFWLGGVRYSTPITGLLGAVVGAAAGLLVGQWLTLHLLLSMVVGAAVLATVSVLLRNILILVLAVLVVAAAAGGGYMVVLLDRVAPTEQAQERTSGEAPAGAQSFSQMEPAARLDYVDRMARQQEDFSERVRAIGTDTFEVVQPHLWKLILAALAGAAVSIFLVWFVKNALIALAYSVVGTGALVVGAQTALLAANVRAASALPANPWLLPGTCGGMVAFGWVVQIVATRKPKEKREKGRKDVEADE